LNEHGVAVVGIDSLRYFWSERTPKGFAADLQKIIDHYRQQWRRDKVMLIGFSQGADVLPATINQLDSASREALERIVLLSVGKKADFEFHV
ncbi:AcvB/VirJ family lysyl-phosphatidylglycerol hydrolase, partial [Klebsiella pneumoniae]|uniref:AcvB/VirJ family lysyl-phosphatidylglycerol hydrolase n=2 Tax=Gammaproteobacteria TaxID=1236 RepID=UPI003F1F1987